MDERKTHYQLSFTGRQALLLFLGLLGALWVAYFLGLRTGLAGHEGRGTSPIAAVSPDSTPTGPSVAASPTVSAAAEPTRGAALVSPSPPPAQIAARERPVQLFEDRGERDARAGPETFWVQVLSTSKEKDARARAAKLSSRGYHASVGSASGPRGAVFRVRVGPYRSREAASKAAQRLSREEKVRAWIVPPGK